MKTLLVQLDIAWESPVENLRRLESLLAPADLVVLPEMFATGFSMAAERIAEPAGGPTERALGDLARRHGAWFIAGLAVQGTSGSPRNVATVISPSGEVVCRAAKQHLFTPSREPEHYQRGSTLHVVRCGPARVMPLVCYDLRFPEAFRVGAMHGAEVMAVIANWPAARIEQWRALLRARAIENQAFVLGVNRCGKDPNVTYCGGSVAFDPLGNTLAEAGDQPEALAMTLDLESQARWRQGFPVLADLQRRWFATDLDVQLHEENP